MVSFAIMLGRRGTWHAELSDRGSMGQIRSCLSSTRCTTGIIRSGINGLEAYPRLVTLDPPTLRSTVGFNRPKGILASNLCRLSRYRRPHARLLPCDTKSDGATVHRPQPCRRPQTGDQAFGSIRLCTNGRACARREMKGSARFRVLEAVDSSYRDDSTNSAFTLIWVTFT
jgi:hypothetical protein